MALVTTFCRQCAQLALTDQQDLLNRERRCLACGGSLRVAPGCSFAEDDRVLFDDLSQVVQESNVDASETRLIALQLAAEIRSGIDHGLLEQLGSRLPGLIATETAAGADPHARRHALKILRAIFEGLVDGNGEAAPNAHRLHH